VSRIRTGASGATTVVMSRPSTTMPGSVQAWMSERNSAFTDRRTTGTRATPLTASVTAGSRIASVTSASPTRTERTAGSVDTTTSKSASASTTAIASDVSMRRRRACHASARYTAPVSR